MEAANYKAKEPSIFLFLAAGLVLKAEKEFADQRRNKQEVGFHIFADFFFRDLEGRKKALASAGHTSIQTLRKLLIY